MGKQQYVKISESTLPNNYDKFIPGLYIDHKFTFSRFNEELKEIMGKYPNKDNIEIIFNKFSSSSHSFEIFQYMGEKEKWKKYRFNDTEFELNYYKRKKSKNILYLLLLPVTIGIDIITFPVQLILIPIQTA